MFNETVQTTFARMRARPAVRALALLATFAALFACITYVVRRSPTIPLREQPLQVKELIEAVRTELAAAEESRRKRGDLPLFELKDFEMEINYLVRNSGGTKAEVIGVGTNLDALSERVQKLRLRWAAIPQQNGDIPPTLIPTAADVAPARRVDRKEN